MSSRYYDTLSAERLRRCYEIAPPAVQAYLRAELRYILAALSPSARVLELGCGYGRVLRALATTSPHLVGIDLSFASLLLARRDSLHYPPPGFARAHALHLPFPRSAFDLVCCPQNGISAFHLEPRSLILAALSVVAPGGRVLFFSYADEFWPHRMAWFRLQAAEGLIGPIDEAASGRATIVCSDGFTATTVTPAQFKELSRGLGRAVNIAVLERSSVVCDIAV